MRPEYGDIFIRDLDLNFQRPELAQFFTYWNERRGARRFPSRADIAPHDITHLLPWLHMYDVVDGGNDFLVRLAGTSISSFFNLGNPHGKSISILPPQIFERLHHHLTAVLLERAPIRFYTKKSVMPGQDFQGSEGCYAPLSGNGVGIDIIICLMMLENRK